MLAPTFLASIYAFVAFTGSAYAVCNPGEIAIGQESVRFTDIIGTHVVYEGIAMNNDCGVLGKTDFAENSLQVCEGEWDAALSVSCTNNVPTSVVTQGRSNYVCAPTTDTSCNSNTGGTDPVAFNVLVCCASA